MAKRPRLSFWQIWNMSFGFLGIQFGFALQNANVSRIFETLGAKIEDIPILWVAAPLTGLIVQPIIGHMSDNTWNRFGRRRPYFMTGALLASCALLFMPNSPVLWVAAGTLWIMDASINISMEPFRAFVGDMLPGDQRTNGFAMQSFFIGIGAVIASALPYILTNWLGVSNSATEGIPNSVKYSFYIGGCVFFLAVLWTVLRTKEYAPTQLEEFEREEHPERFGPTDNRTDEELLPYKRFLRRAFIWLPVGVIICFFIWYTNLAPEIYILGGGITAFGLMELVSGLMIRRGKHKSGFIIVTNDLNRMPKTMAQLAVVQFFTWFALYSMWIYTTAGVTSSKYDMSIDKNTVNYLEQIYDKIKDLPESATMENIEGVAEDLKHIKNRIETGKNAVATVRLVKFFTNEKNKHLFNLDKIVNDRLLIILKAYNTGADWVGLLMAVYNGFAAIMAFLLIWLARRTSRKTVHSISLVIGGLSLISFLLIQNPRLLMISELGIGLAWASILAMPYAILTGSLPQNKMGTYMGIFNFFIVIPQLLAASILGYFVKSLFDGEAIYALVLGGFSMIIAAVMVLFVEDK